MHKKHFFLSNNIAEARGFSPQKQGFDGHTLPSKLRIWVHPFYAWPLQTKVPTTA